MPQFLKFLVGLFRTAPSIGGAVAPVPVGSPPVPGPIGAAKVAVGAGVAVLAVAAMVIAPFEGYFGKTYKDSVGVSTVCFGETDRAAVAKGRTYRFSKEECQKMLADRLPEYDNGAKKCLNRDMPFSVHVAVISLTYNIGIAGFCHSAVARKINAGDFKGACNAFLAYDHGGRPLRRIQGLTNRRVAERTKCLEDVK